MELPFSPKSGPHLIKSPYRLLIFLALSSHLHQLAPFELLLGDPLYLFLFALLPPLQPLLFERLI